MKKKLARFFRLRRHLARVETALLDSMVEVYGDEFRAEEVARLPEYKRFVLSDLENATRRAYAAIKSAKKSKESKR